MYILWKDRHKATDSYTKKTKKAMVVKKPNGMQTKPCGCISTAIEMNHG